jgi:antitoxin component of MazEF toxin-antitoxin module
METQRSIVKMGNSLGVSLPKEMCSALNLEQGDLVNLNVVLLKKKGSAPGPAPEPTAPQSP